MTYTNVYTYVNEGHTKQRNCSTIIDKKYANSETRTTGVLTRESTYNRHTGEIFELYMIKERKKRKKIDFIYVRFSQGSEVL